jgi:hypothetical protein
MPSLRILAMVEAEARNAFCRGVARLEPLSVGSTGQAVVIRMPLGRALR